MLTQVRECKTEEDFKIICDMMIDWGMMPLDRELLPKKGIIVAIDMIDICAGWLYKTDSKIALLEWVVVNKKAPRESRKEGLNFLIDILTQEAQSEGFKVIMTLTHNEMYEKRLKLKNFNLCNELYTNLLFKKIN